MFFILKWGFIILASFLLVHYVIYPKIDQYIDISKTTKDVKKDINNNLRYNQNKNVGWQPVNTNNN